MSAQMAAVHASTHQQAPAPTEEAVKLAAVVAELRAEVHHVQRAQVQCFRRLLACPNMSSLAAFITLSWHCCYIAHPHRTCFTAFPCSNKAPTSLQTCSGSATAHSSNYLKTLSITGKSTIPLTILNTRSGCAIVKCRRQAALGSQTQQSAQLKQ